MLYKKGHAFGKITMVMIICLVIPAILKGQSFKKRFRSDDCKGYTIHKDSVFLYDAYIRFADPKTFKCITGEYAKDKNAVFFATARLQKTNPATFVVLKNGYSKDNNQVYFNYSDAIIPGADPKTFMIYELAISKDKNAVYSQPEIGKIETASNVDAATFGQENGYYYDATYLYSIDMHVLAKRDTFEIHSFFKK
ncbi:hypothetical protein DBR32_14690 [Taibaiella sp. KBW10]|uniref:DKNYY domain-containing protein n=1 Tax=Taibaiella sp. KBW10 TaxID=2153357 RepID=UPI000F5A8506|nr:DKNYY domain-containing protein [Taibaiella sp. KBW10]RQO29828.1 hypothetical protein DBR32_14690 [Taibaiella sp. KBW10]